MSEHLNGADLSPLDDPRAGDGGRDAAVDGPQLGNAEQRMNLDADADTVRPASDGVAEDMANAAEQADPRD